jgi:hypothetical protein
MDGRLVDWGDGATSSATIGKSRLDADGVIKPSGIGVKLDPIAQIAKILNTLARSAIGFDVDSVAGVAALVVKNVSKKVGLGEFIASAWGFEEGFD